MNVGSVFMFPTKIIHATFIIWFTYLYVSPIYFPKTSANEQLQNDLNNWTALAVS